MITMAEIMKAAERSGLAHNGGVRGDYLLVGTHEQLVAFIKALAPAASVTREVLVTPQIHRLLAQDVVEQWADIDQAFQVLYKEAQGLAIQQWYSARTRAARMYLRATQCLGVPVEDRALELADQQTGKHYG